MSAAPRRILVLRFGAYGDVLLAAAAVAALRRALPDAHIGFGVREELAEAVRHHPAVDTLVLVERGEGVLAYARKVRAFAPDVVLDLHGKLRSLVLGVLCLGVPFVRWHQRSLWETVRVRVFGRRPRPTASLGARFHAAIEQLVGRGLPPEPFVATAAPDSDSRAAARLDAAGLGPEAPPLLGLSPGANWVTKRWPAERYAELARLALAAGWRVAVVGSEAERTLGAAVAAAAPGTHDLTGSIDLTALPGFLRRCAVYVGNDSGPTHLARGLGVPTVAIFGSTDPAAVGVPPALVIAAGVDCAPCSFHGRSACPRGDLRCLTEVTAAAVWGRVQAARG